MKTKLKIIDLFSGIGGIRLGFERAAKIFKIKTECVFSSDIYDKACEVYRKNFTKDNHNPYCDITKIDEKSIPDFDVLLAGFPCQAFSIAGRRGGFKDTRGTLFFDIARILKEKRPAAFLLENVKGLTHHRSGKTLETILYVLKEELGYVSTRWEVLNAKNFGLAQNRERIFIVGFRDSGGGFKFPMGKNHKKFIKDILEERPVSVKYYLSATYLNSLILHRKRHENKGNGFGFEIRDKNNVANAILVGGMGTERNLVFDDRLKDFTPVTNIKGEVNKKFIRRMTPLEWERLQGFPENWTDFVADGHRYTLLGNAVPVPVIEKVSYNIIYELVNPVPFTETSGLQLQLNLINE